MMYSKSAQLPFFSWLENAILAPTPISSLLHSSTMVISGVYLGMMYFMNICGLMVSFLVYSVMMCMLGSGLLCALVKGIMLSDMKSIVAYSTISQISYMFLMLCVIWCLVIYHMLVHGVFKSMISLISGSLIHVNYNFQSIYMIRSVSIMIKASFIIAILVLIGSLSKEGIIYSSYYSLCSLWVMDMFLIGGCLTSFYSIGLVWYVCMGVDVR